MNAHFLCRTLLQGVDAAGVDRSQHAVFWTATCGLGAGMAEAMFWCLPSRSHQIDANCVEKSES